MSKILQSIMEKASQKNKNIVLPEGEDKRVVAAACEAVKENLAKVTLLGDIEQIKIDNPDCDLTGVNVVNPQTDVNASKYAEILFELRKGKINKKTKVFIFKNTNCSFFLYRFVCN